MCSAQCKDSVHSDTNRHCVLQMLCTSLCALQILLDTVHYRCCAVDSVHQRCCYRHGALQMLCTRHCALQILLDTVTVSRHCALQMSVHQTLRTTDTARHCAVFVQCLAVSVVRSAQCLCTRHCALQILLDTVQILPHTVH